VRTARLSNRLSIHGQVGEGVFQRATLPNIYNPPVPPNLPILKTANKDLGSQFTGSSWLRASVLVRRKRKSRTALLQEDRKIAGHPALHSRLR